jgi:hypothetical protein
VRVTRRWGPARIGWLLGVHPSTVHRVLSRYRLARLAWLDRTTGRVIRRYEHAAAGELIHVDVKKLARIPDGGGHRIVSRAASQRHARATTSQRRPSGRPRIGYVYLHTALDDHSRLAYTESLPDEQKQTAAAFWHRAHTFFTAYGITVKQVLTDIQSGCAALRLTRRPVGEDRCRRRLLVVVADRSERAACVTSCLLTAGRAGAPPRSGVSC